MKAFTAKDTRTIRRTVVLYPTFQIFLVPIILIGFAGLGFEPAPGKPDDILPPMVRRLAPAALNPRTDPADSAMQPFARVLQGRPIFQSPKFV